MIRIKSLVIYLILISILNVVKAETSDELFKKVFGKVQESKVIVIDVTMGEFLLGAVSATVIGEKIQNLSGPDLEKLLIDKVRDEKKAIYRFGQRQMELESLPFKTQYSPTEMRLAIEIPFQDLKAQDANLFDELVPYFSRKAVDAAPFSFGTNYKLEEVQNSKLNQAGYFQANTDTFVNIKSVSVENQMHYLSSRNTGWYRQNSRLTYDRPHKMQRFEMGDVNFPILGYQQSRSLGGVSVYRDFSLNPYRTSAPTSSFEYDIESRSLVRTYVNNVILKTEYMNPGRYSVRDIPLNNGVNKIVIEATDEFGKKKVLIFNEAGSVDLISPGLGKYALAAGYPSMDGDIEKKYEDEDGAFITSFYQHGINKYWSTGAYFQGNKKYNILGINNVFATQYGNWVMDAGGSKNKFHSGPAAQATYQLNLFGTYWYDAHTLTSRVEYRSPWFNEAGENSRNRFDFITSASYSVPLLEHFNLALGGNYQNPRAGEIARYGFDTSFTSRVFDNSSLTFYYARARDNQLWSTQLYFFLNITFGDSGTFGSAFYEKNEGIKRINLIHDNGKKLYNLKVAASASDNKSSRDGSLDLQYNTQLADFGIRQEVIHTKGENIGTRTSYRFLSSLAYVHNGEDSAFSISRPISNSYVIFKPNSDWKGQTFGVQSTGEMETVSGLFGESLISGLTAYQYRQLQLDPSRLEPGYVLGQESFVVYPRYKSGHLFTVGKSGFLVLKGIILDKNQRPQPLKVGFWTSQTGKTTPFFTGREGEFFIEGVEPTLGRIQLEDEEFEAQEINLEKNRSGLIDIGNIVLPYKESRL